jgi:serine/threonine protein kinase
LSRHPCLVDVYGIEVIEGGQTLIIQELMGSDLKSLRKTKPEFFSNKQILKIAKNVALGLHHLHTARYSGPVVHLDLKWDNILVMAPFFTHSLFLFLSFSFFLYVFISHSQYNSLTKRLLPMNKHTIKLRTLDCVVLEIQAVN